MEDYEDWHYNRSPVVDILTADEDFRTVRNSENNDGHGPTFRTGNEDNIDLYSEPGDRAKLDLSTTEAVVKVDIFDADYVTNGDITVNRRESAGESDTNEDENIRVSMITVDVTQGSTCSHNDNPPEIQDCVCPEWGKQHELSAHMDLELCKKDSLQNMTSNCFGVCGLTHRLNSPDLEWCWECVDRLMWGYLVSCVVSIVTKNRSVGIDVFIEGSYIYASTWGLQDGTVRPCDVIPGCLWMTEEFKDVLNKVMMGNKALVDSHGIQRGGDNGQVRATRASMDNRPIRVAGRFGCLYCPVQGADWLDVLSVDGGPVGKDVWIGYIGDSFSQ